MKLDVYDALEMAAKAHDIQTRKSAYGDVPYIVHPIRVVKLLQENLTVLRDSGTRFNTHLVVGALHDVVEDCGEEWCSQIRSQFGDEVLAEVMMLTTDLGDGRSEKYRRQFERVPEMTVTAKNVKLADMIDNVRGLYMLGIGDKPKWARKHIYRYAYTKVRLARDIARLGKPPNQNLLKLFFRVSSRTLEETENMLTAYGEPIPSD